MGFSFSPYLIEGLFFFTVLLTVTEYLGSQSLAELSSSSSDAACSHGILMSYLSICETLDKQLHHTSLRRFIRDQTA